MNENEENNKNVNENDVEIINPNEGREAEEAMANLKARAKKVNPNTAILIAICVSLIITILVGMILGYKIGGANCAEYIANQCTCSPILDLIQVG